MAENWKANPLSITREYWLEIPCIEIHETQELCPPSDAKLLLENQIEELEKALIRSQKLLQQITELPKKFLASQRDHIMHDSHLNVSSLDKTVVVESDHLSDQFLTSQSNPHFGNLHIPHAPVNTNQLPSKAHVEINSNWRAREHRPDFKNDIPINQHNWLATHSIAAPSVSRLASHKYSCDTDTTSNHTERRSASISCRIHDLRNHLEKRAWQREQASNPSYDEDIVTVKSDTVRHKPFKETSGPMPRTPLEKKSYDIRETKDKIISNKSDPWSVNDSTHQEVKSNKYFLPESCQQISRMKYMPESYDKNFSSYPTMESDSYESGTEASKLVVKQALFPNKPMCLKKNTRSAQQLIPKSSSFSTKPNSVCHCCLGQKSTTHQDPAPQSSYSTYSFVKPIPNLVDYPEYNIATAGKIYNFDRISTSPTHTVQSNLNSYESSQTFSSPRQNQSNTYSNIPHLSKYANVKSDNTVSYKQCRLKTSKAVPVTSPPSFPDPAAARSLSPIPRHPSPSERTSAAPVLNKDVSQRLESFLLRCDAAIKPLLSPQADKSSDSISLPSARFDEPSSTNPSTSSSISLVNEEHKYRDAIQRLKLRYRENTKKIQATSGKIRQ